MPISQLSVRYSTVFEIDARYLDITKSAELQKEYFSMGYYPLDEYKDGYKADYFNKMHMNGKSYLKEC